MSKYAELLKSKKKETKAKPKKVEEVERDQSSGSSSSDDEEIVIKSRKGRAAGRGSQEFMASMQQTIDDLQNKLAASKAKAKALKKGEAKAEARMKPESNKTVDEEILNLKKAVLLRF